MELMFLLISLGIFFILISVFNSLKTNKSFLIRLTGEIYFGVGISLLGGTVLTYSIMEEPKNFFILIISGTILLFIGALMKVTAEILFNKIRFHSS